MWFRHLLSRDHARRSCSPGFTLIELMTAIAVIGVLTTVAVPEFVRYIRKTRTIEVTEGLSKIMTGAVVYFNANGGRLPCTADLPEGGCKAQVDWTPKMTHEEACQNHGGFIPSAHVVDFTSTFWQSLLFQPEGNMRYRYNWSSHSDGQGYADAEIRGMGDLDCDGEMSIWMTRLKTPQRGVIRRQTAPINFGNPLE